MIALRLWIASSIEPNPFSASDVLPWLWLSASISELSLGDVLDSLSVACLPDAARL